MQPGVLQHLDAAVLRGGQDRAGAAVRICSQLGFPDAPALLAQAAASLDLLSSGRFELGIGPTDTNAWDAIEAMGGVRRTPAESVRALSEAIDIIRGIGCLRARHDAHRRQTLPRLRHHARAPASPQYLNLDVRRTAAHSATGRTQGRWLDFGASVDDQCRGGAGARQPHH